MVQIFLEGRETIFIEHLIRSMWPGNTSIDFAAEAIGGWTKLHLADNKFKENTDQGGKNLVIFDADTAQNEGGVSQRRPVLESKREELGIDFDLFLFPDNQSDGDFESLLERIINPTHGGLLMCFNDYETCLQRLNAGSEQIVYKIPMRKAKIYSYVDAFPKSRRQEELFKKHDFFFDNPEFWDFSSEALNPLKSFLSRHMLSSLPTI
ncbi:MAG: DUF3226 domain-containing protein [Saprospiraceae bacterium]